MIKVNNFIYRGPHIGFSFLKMNGTIDATLDLESGKQVFGDDSPLEEAIVGDDHGIRVWAHPLGAILPPTISELSLAAKFLAIQSSKKINTYVHCKHGVDRTGMVIAAYRVLNQGWSPYQAAKECLSLGMHWIYLPWLIQLWRLL